MKTYEVGLKDKRDWKNAMDRYGRSKGRKKADKIASQMKKKNCACKYFPGYGIVN